MTPAKGDKKKPSYPTTLAAASRGEQPSPRGARKSFSPSHAARLLVALGLIALGAASLQVMARNVRGELRAAEAERRMQQPAQGLIVQDLLRDALRHYPSNPQYSLWLGRAIVRYENQKAINADDRTRGMPPQQRAAILAQAIDVNKLKQAEPLMHGARTGYSRPELLQLNVAETSNMISILMANLGNDAEQERYGRQALENYIAYREVVGRPVDDPALFFEPAIRRAYELEEHAQALTFADDFRRFYPAEKKASAPRFRNEVNRSRATVGELPQAASEMARLVLENPSDGRAIGEMIRLARLTGDPGAVLLVMDKMQQAGVWTAELEGYRTEMRNLALRSTRAAQPPTPSQ